MKRLALLTFVIMLGLLIASARRWDSGQSKRPADLAPTTCCDSETEAPGAVLLKSPQGLKARIHLVSATQPIARPLVVEELDSAGKLVKIHRFQCGDLDTAVMEAWWLAPRRLLIKLHVNPDLWPIVDADLDKDTSHEYFGYNLTFDPRLEKVAYIKSPPHFSPPGLPDTVMVGEDNVVCDVPVGSVPRLWWDSEGAILTAEVLGTIQSDHPHLLVVEFRNGKPDRKTWYRKIND
jgi:hypothetical protein